MARQIRVLLVEDDFYARNLMELLLRRDWRTRVVGEVNSPVELSAALEELRQHREQPELILIDTDIPHDPNWLGEVLDSLAKHSPKTGILFTSVAPSHKLARFVGQPNFAGYILKDEIRYSLGWAVLLAAKRTTVITPGVCKLFEGQALPVGTLILDGRNHLSALSKKDTERARMAFIFSMERHEFADELGLSEDYSYGVVSELFEKMGLNDILSGEVKPEQYFGDHPVVLHHVRKAVETIQKAEAKAREKAKNMPAGGKPAVERMAKVKVKETLAFHLLTLPSIETI